ncbi:MAG: PilZ domain-containing protein [Candidatus Omnitrophica bacterium]|nr:PilZ domain-containing protein [Candidatus Omnitrophota bacterium]
MPNAIEKRKFFRHPIHSPIRLTLNRHVETGVSQASDISLGGLSFLWKNKLSKGACVNLSIAVKDKFFEVRGKVMYSKEDKKTGKFRTGVIFVDPPSAFKARLAEQALEIIEYQHSLSRQLDREVTEEEAALKWVDQFAAHFPSAS